MVSPKDLIFTFDLKGSTHGRKSKGEVTPRTIQKDLDLAPTKRKHPRLFEMNDLTRKLRKVMLQDTRFLQRHGFLDYSLLLAVEKSKAEFDIKKAINDKRLTRGLVKRRKAFHEGVSSAKFDILMRTTQHIFGAKHESLLRDH